MKALTGMGIKMKNKRQIKPADFVYLSAVVLMIIIALRYEIKETTDYELSLGDKVTFGTYLDEPIEWRVLKLYEDHFGRASKAVLVSNEILTMKAFDAAPSGKYAYDDEGKLWRIGEEETLLNLEMQEYTHGTSDWSRSDIRIWLNSNQENVVYDGKGPIKRAMAEERNGYASEKGFLCGFSDEEQGAIVSTHNITKGNALAKGDVETEDLVYLLSEEELAWFYDANISIYALPTKQAVKQDETNSYQIFSLSYGVDTYLWRLREPVDGYSTKSYAVNNGYSDKRLIECVAAVEGYGIRPAVTVDIKKLSDIIKKQSKAQQE